MDSYPRIKEESTKIKLSDNNDDLQTAFKFITLSGKRKRELRTRVKMGRQLSASYCFCFSHWQLVGKATKWRKMGVNVNMTRIEVLRGVGCHGNAVMPESFSRCIDVGTYECRTKHVAHQ